MDQFSHRVANYLVGNDDQAATLEMSYQGCNIEFQTDTTIAITGADMSAELNDEPIPTWEAVQVEEGDVLSNEYATSAVYSYLAVSGGFEIGPVMGSKSTFVNVAMGGHEGRPLEEGDVLKINHGDTDIGESGRAVKEKHIPDYSDGAPIDIVVGLCSYRITEESLEAFLSSDWKLTPDADRVGYRLSGPDIEFKEREQPFGAGSELSNVVDMGYPIGSIQVPEQPIVLMRDAVTAGGYATIGTVIGSDRARFAQHQAHQSVTFNSVDIDEALEKRKNREETLEMINKYLN
jgi:biotin-dependent carboxylase-like uncharacterized protein